MDEPRTRLGWLLAGARWLRVAVAKPAAAVRSGDEAGQGLAEYAFILSLIAIVAIAAVTFFGLQVSSVLTDPVGRDFGGVVDLITH